jgi:sulfate adenylyltransferase
MKINVLCTLGPASLDADILRELDERGVDLFRINLSHTPLEAVVPTIEWVRRHSTTPICLDTEGAQVRCGNMAPDVVVEKGQMVRLTATELEGSSEELTLHPASTFAALEAGSLLSIDFDGALLRVTDRDEAGAIAAVVNGGRIRSNKAATVDPPPALAPLTDKDVRAIELAQRYGIEHFALSFASSADDVALVRTLTSPSAFLISKLESRAGIRNMDRIIQASDAVLIDRGDLSREVPLEHVPFYQKVVVRRANRWSTPVFVATNLLESMVTNRKPTVAEADDIVNTLLDGVHGLVLAAETAIGVDPVGTVDMILRVVEAFERWNLGPLLEEDRLQTITPSSRLGAGIVPAGSWPNGQLARRKAVPSAEVGE